MLRYAAEFADRYDKIGADRIGGNMSRRAESIERNYKMGAPYSCLSSHTKYVVTQ